MDNNEFLTEAQTLYLTGVDKDILDRFCETGYIKTKVLSNGETLYSKQEIERVFGKKLDSFFENVSNSDVAYHNEKNDYYQNREQKASRLIKFPESAKASISSIMQDIPDFSSMENVQEKAQDVSNNDLQDDFEKMQDNLKRMQDNLEKMKTEMQEAKEKERLQKENENNQNQNVNANNLRQENETLRQEIVKLQSYARLQKKLLEVKEKEIGELKQEKDWLKERIEAQEEKNNRDQLLILSETKVIHNLIESNHKQSTLRTALEWFGFSKKQPKETIDIRNK